jgi:hypothetical protein
MPASCVRPLAGPMLLGTIRLSAIIMISTYWLRPRLCAAVNTSSAESVLGESNLVNTVVTNRVKRAVNNPFGSCGRACSTTRMSHIT